MFLLGVCRTAMFAEPTVTKIEEVVGLIHRTGFGVSGLGRLLPDLDTQNPTPCSLSGVLRRATPSDGWGCLSCDRCEQFALGQYHQPDVCPECDTGRHC